ncbi:SIR2 family NAD-dependent protein deacylase [Paenibacillus tianjinensis]|uniref:SIR2 family protein n=1 Tax=Paenibacillus tianjinensis TaxID=2810347 RepID=A0ABX7LEZ0_9BACL|nr:SIR2 family protein [Paenibacillus tianjinensis]QSF46521.1 SIR2 family protein [Paenibacillus tianjinensis]
MRAQLVNDLNKLYNEGNLVPFLGSGLSTPFDIPNWSKLIELISSRNLEQDFMRQTVLFSLKNNNYWEAINDIKRFSGMNDRDIQDSIVNIINEKKLDDIPDNLHNYKELGELDFKIYLTTNYDHILFEHIKNISGFIPQNLNEVDLRSSQLLNPLGKRIYHLHGNISNQGSIVISKEQYNDLYNNEKYEAIFKTLATSKQFIFIGFSFTDQYFSGFLEKIQTFSKNKHYIVLNNPDDSIIKHFKDTYELEVIPYYVDKTNQHAHEIRKILSVISNKKLLSDNYASKLAPPSKLEAEKDESLSIPDRNIIDVDVLFGNDSGENDHNLHSYFINTEEYNRIKNGNIFLVSGKRGTGKSSIAKMLKADKPNSCMIIRPDYLQIDNIREQAKTIPNEIFRNKLSKIWLNTIYALMVKNLISQTQESELFSKENLSSFYDFTALNSQDQSFVGTFVSFLKLLTTEQNLSYQSKSKFENVHFNQIDKELAQFPELKDNHIFILFDNLDDDYDLDPDFTILLVNSLIKASMHIVRESTIVKPIIFLREDILSIIAKKENSFISQMRGNVVELRWNKHKLLEVLNTRICHFFTKKHPPKHLLHDPKYYLCKIYPEEYTYIGKNDNKVSKPIGDYLIERSLLRPRELIHFCRKIIEVNNYKYPLTNKNILDSEEKFVKNFIEDLCAEYKKLYPNLRDVIEAFRKNNSTITTKGWLWSKENLNKLFTNEISMLDYQNNTMSSSDAINALYKVGLLRAIDKKEVRGKPKASYKESAIEADFDTDRVDEFDIHRLFRAELKFEKRLSLR